MRDTDGAEKVGELSAVSESKPDRHASSTAAAPS
jgi:hypothetical protein